METPINSKLGTNMCLTMAIPMLLKEAEKGLNFVFSPLSLNAMLSLLAAGANSNGSTLQHLLCMLGAESVEELNHWGSQMGSSVLEPSNGGPVSSFVNGAWLDSRFGFKPSFQHVVNHVYHATTTNVDFSHKANQIEDEVNLWAENATRGLIKSIIPAGTITSDTTLILANALYFKGAWDQKFNPSLSKPKTFHLLNGQTIQTPFMNAKKRQQFLFGSFNGYKVIQLPYQKGQDTRRFSMCFFLPNATNGLKSLIDRFKANPDKLFNPSGLWKRTLSELCIPRFKFSFGFEALSASRELGIEQLLSLGEFTEIVDSMQSVSVSKLLHKAFIEVNEEGTEAAAATIAVLRMNRAGPIEFPSFIADHPFVFTVKEDNSGTTLFFGAVLNPLSVS